MRLVCGLGPPHSLPAPLRVFGTPQKDRKTRSTALDFVPGARVSQRGERPGPMGYWSRHAADDQSPSGCRSMASLTLRAAHGPASSLLNSKASSSPYSPA